MRVKFLSIKIRLCSYFGPYQGVKCVLIRGKYILIRNVVSCLKRLLPSLSNNLRISFISFLPVVLQKKTNMHINHVFEYEILNDCDISSTKRKEFGQCSLYLIFLHVWNVKTKFQISLQSSVNYIFTNLYSEITSEGFEIILVTCSVGRPSDGFNNVNRQLSLCSDLNCVHYLPSLVLICIDKHVLFLIVTF